MINVGRTATAHGPIARHDRLVRGSPSVLVVVVRPPSQAVADVEVAMRQPAEPGGPACPRSPDQNRHDHDPDDQ
jgi:hypothetical protein